MDAPEKIAATDEIICGKTSTITSDYMEVKELFIDGKTMKYSGKNIF